MKRSDVNAKRASRREALWILDQPLRFLMMTAAATTTTTTTATMTILVTMRLHLLLYA